MHIKTNENTTRLKLKRQMSEKFLRFDEDNNVVQIQKEQTLNFKAFKVQLAKED